MLQTREKRGSWDQFHKSLVSSQPWSLSGWEYSRPTAGCNSFFPVVGVVSLFRDGPSVRSFISLLKASRAVAWKLQFASLIDPVGGVFLRYSGSAPLSPRMKRPSGLVTAIYACLWRSLLKWRDSRSVHVRISVGPPPPSLVGFMDPSDHSWGGVSC